MIVTPIRNMCGAGLISGFEPSSALEGLFACTREASGQGANMFKEKPQADTNHRTGYCASSYELMGLQLLFSITCARFPSYQLYTSTQTYAFQDFLDKIGLKPVHEFVSYASSNRVRLYSVLQHELHKMLVDFCLEAYTAGKYDGFNNDKYPTVQQAIQYLISSPWASEEGEERDDYDEEDYYDGEEDYDED